MKLTVAVRSPPPGAGWPLDAARASTVLAAGLLALLGHLPAAAASDGASGGTTTASVEVGSAVTLEGLSSSFALPGLPGPTEGGSSAVAYRVLTNNQAGYAVSVQADTSELVPAGPFSDAVPVRDLTVSTDGSSAHTPLSERDAVTLHSSATRSDGAGDDYTDDYRLEVPLPADCACLVTLSYVVTPG